MQLRLSHLALFVGLSVSAAAQSVLSFAPTVLPEVSIIDGSVRNISVPGFDSSLGELTQVKLAFSSSVYQSSLGQNLSGGTRSFTSTSTVGLTLKDSGNQVLAQLTNVQFGSGTLANNAAFSADETTLLSQVAFDSAFSNYIDVAAVNFTIDLQNPPPVFAMTGNSFSIYDAAGDAILSVEYTFTPIPEPEFYAAVLGLALLGLLVRRSHRSVPLGSLAAS